MTEGRPFKLILQFALPLLVGNLLQQTYNIIDAAIVGRVLGAAALASVGSTSSVQFMVLGFSIGCCTGFGVPVAKCFGAGRLEKMKHYIFSAAVLTGMVAAVLTVLCAFLCPWILQILSVSEELYGNAYRYLLVIFLGLPFTFLYNLLAGILRAVGDSRTPFIFLVISTALNIILDLVCIMGFGWGCAGAAIATASSQAASGILCLLFIYKKVEFLHPGREKCRLEKEASKELLSMGLPMGFQFSITAIGSMVMQSVNNSLGSVYVSGFTAALKIKQFTICPFDAMASAVSVYCGQNLGAGRLDRIRQGVREGMILVITYGVSVGLALVFTGRTLSMLFVGQEAEAVLDAAARYLKCLGLFYWSLGVLNVARLSIQGLGYAGRAVFAGVMEMAARSAVSLGLVGTLGFTAVCFADQTAWMSACLYLVPMYFLCMKQTARKLGKNR
ncbi:MAG: MATE family efflux transporter [Lachnospiraceae bacterium]|nr:MATE family efflux transporter [Lachnospiraceae bacterium]